MNAERQLKKIALVTGSNRGIGKEIVKQLAKKGYRVILSCRFAEKGLIALESLKDEKLDVEFIQLDVTDEYSIKEAVKNIQLRFGHIDVLVNNAAVLLDGKDDLLSINSSKIFQTFHTNSIGALMISKAMIPLMKTGGRIIMISSGGGSICGGISTWSPVYCISKTTLNAITMQLASALEGKGITVNAVCPGWVRTAMGGVGASRTVSKGAETAVWLATDDAVKATGKFWRDKKTIEW